MRIALHLFSFLFWLPSFANTNFDQLTLGQKVGQLLMVHFHGEQANSEAKYLIQEIGVGGIIYYNWANGLNSPEQVYTLSRDLQNLTLQNPSGIPLLLAVDQEGGRVARLTQGFTVFPGNGALGICGDPDLAEQSAFAIGEELKAVGINMNLAPVVDIEHPLRNTIINSRSFGSNPEIVITYGQRALQGLKKAGIIPTLKHFPGHGSVEVDSHCEMPILKKSKEELLNWDIRPFAVLAKGADAIMTAHILVPAIDEKNCATSSKNVLNILREKLGFEGVIISDSLVMEGLLKNCTTIDEGAIRAFNAGCDLILLGGKQLHGTEKNMELTVNDIQRIHRTFIDAVLNGNIQEERINTSVKRILRLKEKYEIFHRQNIGQDNFPQTIGTPEHHAIANKIKELINGSNL